jgi:hypothetical protein
VLGDNTNDANTLLTLNMPETKQKITDGFETGIASLAAPAPVKEALKKDFETKQNDFGDKIVNAFADSMHTIFYVTSGVMLLALLLSFTLKERPLQAASPEMTPSEI